MGEPRLEDDIAFFEHSRCDDCGFRHDDENECYEPDPDAQHDSWGSGMNNIVGLCSDSDDPDLWHPEIPRGGLSAKTGAELRARTLGAIRICNNCPVQQECLAEGMLDENLPWGIWGGKLAGERVLLSGKTYRPNSDEGLAMRSYGVLAPLIGGTRV